MSPLATNKTGPILKSAWIRDELLNAHSFVSIFEARRKAVDWRHDYNDVRPHSALGYRTPREFAEQFNSLNPHSYQLRKLPPHVIGHTVH